MKKDFIIVWGEKKDENLAYRVRVLLERNDGAMPLQDFRRGLEERFSFDPITGLREIPKKHRPRITELARSKIYPIIEGFVYEPSANIARITNLSDPKDREEYLANVGQRE